MTVQCRIYENILLLSQCVMHSGPEVQNTCTNVDTNFLKHFYKHQKTTLFGLKRRFKTCFSIVFSHLDIFFIQFLNVFPNIVNLFLKFVYLFHGLCICFLSM